MVLKKKKIDNLVYCKPVFLKHTVPIGSLICRQGLFLRHAIWCKENVLCWCEWQDSRFKSIISRIYLANTKASWQALLILCFTIRKKNMGLKTPLAGKSLTVWVWIIPWTWTRIEGAGTWRLYRILLRRTHVGGAVAILGDKTAHMVTIREQGRVQPYRHKKAEEFTHSMLSTFFFFSVQGLSLSENSMFPTWKKIYSLKPVYIIYSVYYNSIARKQNLNGEYVLIHNKPKKQVENIIIWMVYFWIFFCIWRLFWRLFTYKNNNKSQRVKYHAPNPSLKWVSHLWDVVLCSLRGGERHRRHGHHDWLIGWVNGCCGSLRAWPYGGSVGGHGGPRRLHLSPLEKLEVTRERNGKCYFSFKEGKKETGGGGFNHDATEAKLFSKSSSSRQYVRFHSGNLRLLLFFFVSDATLITCSRLRWGKFVKVFRRTFGQFLSPPTSNTYMVTAGESDLGNFHPGYWRPFNSSTLWRNPVYLKLVKKKPANERPERRQKKEKKESLLQRQCEVCYVWFAPHYCWVYKSILRMQLM